MAINSIEIVSSKVKQNSNNDCRDQTPPFDKLPESLVNTLHTVKSARSGHKLFVSLKQVTQDTQCGSIYPKLKVKSPKTLNPLSSKARKKSKKSLTVHQNMMSHMVRLYFG